MYKNWYFFKLLLAFWWNPDKTHIDETLPGLGPEERHVRETWTYGNPSRDMIDSFYAKGTPSLIQILDALDAYYTTGG